MVLKTGWEVGGGGSCVFIVPDWFRITLEIRWLGLVRTLPGRLKREDPP